MPRNRSEKDTRPSMEGVHPFVVEVMRLDALCGKGFEPLAGDGHTLLQAANKTEWRAYVGMKSPSLRTLYDEWVSYYRANPDRRETCES